MAKPTVTYFFTPFKSAIILLIPATPFLALWLQSLAVTVDALELGQIVLLAICGLYCLHYARRLSQNDPNRAFWFWAAAWWLLLIARSVNWGRQFFPLIPKFYFHLFIFLPLAAAILLPLFLSPGLQRAIATKWQKIPLDAVGLMLVIVTYLLVDFCDHPKRLLGTSWGQAFVAYFPNMAFLEELFEFSFIAALLQICFYYIKLEKNKAQPR